MSEKELNDQQRKEQQDRIHQLSLEMARLAGSHWWAAQLQLGTGFDPMDTIRGLCEVGCTAYLWTLLVGYNDAVKKIAPKVEELADQVGGLDNNVASPFDRDKKKSKGPNAISFTSKDGDR